MRSFGSAWPALVFVLAVASQTAHAQPSSAEALFAEAMAREATLREDIAARQVGETVQPLLDRARTLAQTFEDISRLFPDSPDGDRSLWQAADLSTYLFEQFGDTTDQTSGLRLVSALEARFPTSPLLAQVPEQRSRLLRIRPARPAQPAAEVERDPSHLPLLTAIRREVQAGTIRVTIELEREVRYRTQRIERPPRILVDLPGARVGDTLRNGSFSFGDGVVTQIHVSTPESTRAQVTLGVDAAARYSVYTLYNPYRIVLDFENVMQTAMNATEASLPSIPASWMVGVSNVPPPARALTAPPAPTPAAANTAGGFSLARQLGLDVGRIVIDPGHGGHDPGAKVAGLTEAALVLDIALRLEKLLLAQPGAEVVLTRRTDVFRSLEERTSVANETGADALVSIHVNANADGRLQGFETYFLDFSPNAAARAVAARENAGATRTMRDLPDLVQRIARNNQIDESRDLAVAVQGALVDRLRTVNHGAKDLGVKKAPFMVLVGATMPGILVEISFLSNRQEEALLRTRDYRQQVAEALFEGVTTYRRSLKASQRVAAGTN